MVAFTQSTYSFTPTESKVWFPLLLKYIKNVDVNVSLVVSNTESIQLTGKVHRDFFDSILTKCESNFVTKIMVETQRFWSELVTSNALPDCASVINSIPFIGKEDVEAIVPLLESISNMIKRVIKSGHTDIGISALRFPKDTTFKHLLIAVKQYCIANPQDVSKMFISYTDESVIFHLAGSKSLFLTTGEFTQVQLPVLDLDDGFSEGVFGSPIPSEFPQLFTNWLKSFKSSGGETWNLAIIKEAN